MTCLRFLAPCLFGLSAAVALSSQASAFPAVTLAAQPDSAVVQVLCKYGTPHCIDKHTPYLPEVGGAQFPDSGWEDPDCKYYGNCNPGPDNWGDPAARKAAGRLQAGRLSGLLK